MPIVTVQITREGTTAKQKPDLIRGMTEVLSRVRNKSPALTHVLIQKVDTDSWGVGGLPGRKYRQHLANSG